MLICAHCNYTTNRLYNLNRHIITHDIRNNNNENVENVEIENDNNTSPKVVNMAPKVVNTAPKVVNMAPKVVNSAPKVINVAPKVTKHKCLGCYKEFCFNKTLVKHITVCKKIQHPCECPNCHVVFENKQQVYRHKRKDNCTSTALILVDETPKEVTHSSETTNINSIETQNNIGQMIQTQNNTTNTNTNNNITINVFPTSLHSDYNINTDHINLEELKRDIKHQSIFEAVGTSLRKVLQNGENLPVKKKSIKSNYSYIHVGNNQWEMRKDKEIYGLISFHMSRCIQVYLDGNNLQQIQKYYQEATEALEFVATDNMEDLEKEYIKKAKRIMDILMISSYERTDTVDIGSILQKVKTTTDTS